MVNQVVITPHRYKRKLEHVLPRSLRKSCVQEKAPTAAFATAADFLDKFPIPGV